MEKFLNKELVSFLKENKAYDEFIVNINDEDNNGAFALDEWDEDETDALRIADVFNWSRTPQHHSYWSDLNRKWEDESGE